MVAGYGIRNTQNGQIILAERNSKREDWTWVLAKVQANAYRQGRPCGYEVVPVVFIKHTVSVSVVLAQVA